MAAGLERHVGGRSTRFRTGALERFGLGMGPSAPGREAAADDTVVFDEDTADGGIGPAVAERARGERQRRAHECARLSRHQRFCSAPLGSVKVSTKFSKSLTSRKFL